jgi:hypothetical protein
MAYDPVRHSVLLYGGWRVDGGTLHCDDFGTVFCSTDTWSWSGTTWTELHPQGVPDLGLSKMAYDYGAGRMVLYGFKFGGYGTWTWDGSTWSGFSAESSNPSPGRIDPAMTWDPASGHVVMFRGFSQGGGNLLAMWKWTGQNWTPLSVDSPVQAASGYSDRGVLLGYESPYYHGTAANMIRDGGSATWQWDGSRWTQLKPAHDPNVFVYGMFDDPTSHRVLLVGREPYGTFQIWAWGGSDWSQLG